MYDSIDSHVVYSAVLLDFNSEIFKYNSRDKIVIYKIHERVKIKKSPLFQFSPPIQPQGNP
jgi:hypothetical protein